MLIELDRVDRVTADAVGEPGDRSFFLQVRKGDRLITMLVEKQQVQLLAASIVEILARVGKETGDGPPEDAMGLEDPVLPEWRAGRLAIGYEEDRDLILLEVEELVPGDDEEEDQEGEEVAPGLSLGPPIVFPTELEEAAGEEHEEAGDPTELGPDEEEEPNGVRLWATREQMLSLARHGAIVCAAGRPRCRLCGNPIDPDGHVCPALNGHKRPATP